MVIGVERMSAERYMVDDAGTLIDKVTRDNFDTVEEVVSIMNHYASTLEKLVDENESLKERNKRQYNQLNELWNLIENKDWETLTEMIKQMKKDEEQLESEWGFING